MKFTVTNVSRIKGNRRRSFFRGSGDLRVRDFVNLSQGETSGIFEMDSIPEEILGDRFLKVEIVESQAPQESTAVAKKKKNKTGSAKRPKDAEQPEAPADKPKLPPNIESPEALPQ